MYCKFFYNKQFFTGIILIILPFVILLSCSINQNINRSDKKNNPKKIKVFLLAGQSNMDGRARAKNLTAEDKVRLEKAKKNVILYYNHQPPVPLQVTKGSEYIQKKFKAESFFGPELFFGINMSEQYPENKIILIKRSKGGMSLYGAWNPNWSEEKAKVTNEENQPKLYNDFITYADSILKTYNKSEYELCGMLWVQGETDSGKRFGPKPAEDYEKNLKSLIRSVRKDLAKPNLPFLIFQVGRGKVVEGMKNTAKDFANVSLIPQSSNKNSEDYFVKNPPPLGHYTYVSMKRIGRLFFKYYQDFYANKK